MREFARRLLVKNFADGNQGAIPPLENIMTETFRQSLNKQLTRVIAINLTCLVVFIGFCTLMTSVCSTVPRR
jgi:hypothetical protein